MCLLVPLPVTDMQVFSFVATFSLIASSFGSVAAMPSDSPHAIDAVSVTLASETATAEVRARIDGRWTAWQPLAVENEQDPTLLESNLVMFPASADDIDVRGDVTAVHPIRVSNEPTHYTVAATGDVDAPRILSRLDWGADESLRYSKQSSSSSSPTPAESAGDNGGATSQRVQDCEAAQLNYPNEFKTTGRIVKEENGQTLLWPRTYSKEVKLLAVHHTAMKVEGDNRSGVERVRALYQYHAQNRGWGDIGYHYLVDEDGKIYEGKAGGEYVIGGHAYCNNTGTIGIALLGNFEVEQPTQKQLKALQWLLADLSETYDIDPSEEVTYHGKKTMPIVGHRDLLSTDCPGYYVYGAMSQIRMHVAQGDTDASVKLPKMLIATSKSSSSRRSTRVTQQSSSTGTNRRVARLLDTDASRALRRKLGSNPGKETENGVAARRAARLSGSSVSRSSRSVVRSSVSRSSRSSIARSTSSRTATSVNTIRIRLTSRENGATRCNAYDLAALQSSYRGSVECLEVDGKAAIINEVTLDDYLLGLAEEPDTEPYEKQRAFAIAARTYAAWYMDEAHRKFPGMPYDGSDSPATFQKYNGRSFEANNPRWLDAVRDTANEVLTFNGEVIKPPYFSSDDGRTRTPTEAGWNNFPFAEIFAAKDDPWCAGMELRGHGVGMSGCGAEGQANDGKTGEEILQYYYPGTDITSLR
jgi:peptidoglycan hydrolase-like amidase